MMMKRVLLLGVVLASLLPAGCGPEARPRFFYAIENYPTSLDPIDTAGKQDAALVSAQIAEPLFAFQSTDLGVVPWLVDDLPALSGEGLVYELSLRNNIRFQNGDPLDAEAVVFSLNRMRTALAGRSPFPDVIASVDAPDPLTVRIMLRYPYSPLLKDLARPVCGIVSPRAVKEMGEKFKLFPVGTGPYRVTSNTPEDGILLDLWSGYWFSGSEVGSAHPEYIPALESVRFRAAGTEEERVSAVLAGDYDVTSIESAEGAEWAGGSPGVRVESNSGTQVIALVMDPAAPPYNSRDVRVAVARAIDKDAFIDRFLPGVAEVATEVLPPAIWGYVSRPERFAYDPAEARSLLAAAGHPEGFETTLVISPAFPVAPEDRSTVREYFASALAEIGIKVRGKPFENKHEEKGVSRPGLRLEVLDAPNGDADRLLAPFAVQSGTGPGAVNPLGEHYLGLSRRTTDVQGRLRQYAELDAAVYENVPAVFLAHPNRMVAVRSRVRRFDVQPTGVHRLATVRMQ